MNRLFHHRDIETRRKPLLIKSLPSEVYELLKHCREWRVRPVFLRVPVPPWSVLFLQSCLDPLGQGAEIRHALKFVIRKFHMEVVL
jgi:hypothetical protein